jgi:hypothetical protein
MSKNPLPLSTQAADLTAGVLMGVLWQIDRLCWFSLDILVRLGLTRDPRVTED